MAVIASEFERCDPIEEAAGWVYGFGPDSVPPLDHRTPREALDDAIRPALLRDPCYVTFSGGRDSSAVLAAATSLARREGLSLPIPVTRIYPNLPDTEEGEWQRAVVEHLRLTDWLRFEFRSDETDLLGPAARAGLLTRGVLWPPAMQTFGAVFERLGSGSLITGEGGDAVLGPRRGAAMVMLRRRHRGGWPLILSAAVASLPRPALYRRCLAIAKNSVQGRWMRPDALEEHARRAASDAVAEPMRYDRGTWQVTRRRSFIVIRHHHARIAAEYGIVATDPLLDASFVAALARAGGRDGYVSRTEVMRALFATDLPQAVLSRTSKASFNNAHRTSTTRDFAQSWDGTGVRAELVDVDQLREVWLSDRPTMATGMLLHRAWLASRDRNP